MSISPWIRLWSTIAMAFFAIFSSGAAPAAEVDRGRLRTFVADAVGDFHERRIERLRGLELDEVLGRKNPYLLKAGGAEEPDELVGDLLELYLATQEAGLFGSTLEQIALHVCGEAYGGRKSGIEGIDIEFERGDTRYIVSVKSGPSWGNSSSIRAMREDFAQAKRILGTNTEGATQVIAVNGCCYGRENNPDKGGYLKLCGEEFWELISGESDFHATLMELIGEEFEAQRHEFDAAYAEVSKAMTLEFAEVYQDGRGKIDWAAILEMNSGGGAKDE